MVSVEEKFLVNILYREESESLQGVDIINVNFENLMKLASRHLMLPALFFNINKKNLSHLFPVDFIKCIKKIYLINKSRNKILLKEAKELSEILYKNNINHIFLKGTALLLSNVFEDIGERMMCDIDFIIQHKNEEKVIKLLNKYNYFGSSLERYQNLFKIFKPKHMPRFINENKMIGLELHTELLTAEWRHIFNSKKLITTFKDNVKTLKTPNKFFLFDHCIYALQLEDQRIFNLHHSHRSIYDIYKLDCKKSLTIEYIKKNIYIKHFFLNINKLKIFEIDIRSSSMNSYFDKSFKIVRKFSTYVARYFVKKILVNISR
tara:strand:+ start:22 stop:981 length:960 start_codon:yes stop_codon:yes gene_type:complete